MDKQKVVVIKLKKWQIPRLLGAMRLGIWAEDWCAALVQSGINTYDTHSGMWIFSVGTIIDSIKKHYAFFSQSRAVFYSQGRDYPGSRKIIGFIICF